MKKLITAALSLVFMVGLSGLAVAGSLDAPGAPSAGSGMYTLQNLYDYIVSGTALTVQTGFQEPIAAPASTMKTTKEIGDALKSSFGQCNVTADNVELGKTFFCTLPGSWGVQTGRVCIAGTPTPTETPTPTPTITSTSTPTGTPYGVYASCKAIKTATPSAGNGVYTIDPDGLGGADPFSVYCDMTTAGGGWTLAGFRGQDTNTCATFTKHGTVTTDFSESTSVGSWGLSLGGGYINGGATWEEMTISCGGQYPSISSYPYTAGFKFAEPGGYRLSENWCSESESGNYKWRCAVTNSYSDGTEWYNMYPWIVGHSGYIPGTGIEAAGWRIYGNPCGMPNTTSYGYIWVR